MSRNAKQGDKVSIHYTGRLDDGTEFDSSRGSEPIEFELGSGEVIPGVEQAVEGMAVGQQREVRIEPVDGYGERREDLRVEVQLSRLPDDVPAKVGQMLAVQIAPDQQTVARIASVDGDTVTLDLNHPLAGQHLNFDIELMAITDTV